MFGSLTWADDLSATCTNLPAAGHVLRIWTTVARGGNARVGASRRGRREIQSGEQGGHEGRCPPCLTPGSVKTYVRMPRRDTPGVSRRATSPCQPHRLRSPRGEGIRRQSVSTRAGSDAEHLGRGNPAAGHPRRLPLIASLASRCVRTAPAGSHSGGGRARPQGDSRRECPIRLAPLWVEGLRPDLPTPEQRP